MDWRVVGRKSTNDLVWYTDWNDLPLNTFPLMPRSRCITLFIANIRSGLSLLDAFSCCRAALDRGVRAALEVIEWHRRVFSPLLH
jgi:hypothetical protein